MLGSSLQVVVVGGGLGGLCLAQGLKRAGVGVTVYERDAAPLVRRQGYRIHLDSRGARGLYECLPARLYDLVVATSSSPGRQVTVVNARLQTRRVIHVADETAMPNVSPSTTDPTAITTAVNRLTLREILLAGLDDVVHFDKEFIRYERRGDGGVRAHFADGSVAEGDALIAADGVGSRIRQQYLPHAAVIDTGARCIYGKTLLTADTRSLAPAAVFDGFTAVGGPRGVGLALGLMEFRQRPDEAAALWPGLRVHSCDDYLMWGLTARRERFRVPDADLLTRDSPALQGIALEMIARWHPHLRALIERCDLGETFILAIPIAPWPTSTVTLLGDAIHAMSPAGGSGANTALRDAGLLCRQLVAAAHGEVPLLAAIRAYKGAMIAYGFDAVRASQRAPGRFFGPAALARLTHGVSDLARRLRPVS